MDVQEYIPLASRTTFGIGGTSRYFIEVTSDEELRAAVAFAQNKRLNTYILGGGSNTLFADDGFDGLVIKIALKKVSVNRKDGTAVFGTGVLLRDAIMETAKAGLSGWEPMYGIPGTLGGAVRGNAGAFGKEVTDVLACVHALNIQTGEERDFTHDECQFGYRMSFFKQHPEWIVTEATVQLVARDADECVSAAQGTLAEREKRQIQNIRSAGSFFMNPVAPDEVVKMFEQEKGVTSRGGKVPAGWLIDKVGFKGYEEAHVATGVRSSNYIINKGGATAEEVMALGEKIQHAVKKQFGVLLEMEVRLVA